MRPEAARYFRYFTYIKPVTKIPIVRTYGATIFTLFATAIFILFAIKPTVETILVLQKKLENYNQTLGKVNKKATDLSQGKQNYQNLDKETKDKIRAAIPDSLEIRSAIQTLELAAQRHEASVSALQLQPLTIDSQGEDTIGTLDEFTFTFNVEGSYQNLISLLQDLRRSARLISIDTLTLNKVSEGENLIMSISGKAYYLKQ